MAAIESNFVMSSSGTSQGPSGQSPKQAENSGVSAPTYASFIPPPSSLPQNTSPLLSSTPPTVTKALSQAYPMILSLNFILGLLTWTGDDVWKSFLMLAVWTAGVLHFETLIYYLGHLVAVALVAGYVWFHKAIHKHQEAHPSLDEIVHTLNNAVTRLDLLLLPVTNLSLSSHDLTRLMFTTLFLSPLYIILTFFILSPRTVVYISGLFVLTYHSMWARVTRSILWRSRTIRLMSFYLTGLDFSGSRKLNVSEVQLAKSGSLTAESGTDGKPVVFTYVLYENQRRWLGIGWTANLLAYERAAWTDEFLNESVAPSSFKLPDADGTAMEWRWVDTTWRLDLTNDGALTVKGKSTTPDPASSEGFIYYDNMWKKPSAEDSYSKYTRRRRWVRTAELVSGGATHEPAAVTVGQSAESPAARQRKSIRFEEK